VCWDVCDAIIVINDGGAATDSQLTTVVRACRTSYAWNFVMDSDFIENELISRPSRHQLLKVCVQDAFGAQRIFALSICTGLIQS